MEKEALIKYWVNSGLIKNKAVLNAFKKIPREEFIPKQLHSQTYEDIPLPIYEKQTISQPTTVMLMTQDLEPKKGQKILEIGSGSGYQAAILSEIIGKKGKIYTLEILPKLAKFARSNIKKLNIKNIEVICADGSKGYPKKAPFDRIIVTAGAPEAPIPLIKQLKDKGILVIPIGPLYSQEMFKIVKDGPRLHIKKLGGFRFVPLLGKYGHKA